MVWNSRFWKRTLCCTALLPLWYLAAFALTTSSLLLAFDKASNEWVNQSGYFMAPGVMNCSSGITIAGPAVCWANRFFWPIDWAVFHASAWIGFPIPSWVGEVHRVVSLLVLLMPFWVTLYLIQAEGGMRQGTRIFLALVSAAWCSLLAVLAQRIWPDVPLALPVFILFLLMPSWLPFCFRKAGSRKRQAIGIFLALIPTAWYFGLLFLAGQMPPIGGHFIPRMLIKAIGAAGSAVAFWVLARNLRGWWYATAVPLGFAIASGAVSLLVLY